MAPSLVHAHRAAQQGLSAHLLFPLFFYSFGGQDKTFTCTLFAPTAELDRLSSPDSILAWFKFYFSDAVHKIGEQMLLADFLKNPRSPLICTKVRRLIN